MISKLMIMCCLYTPELKLTTCSLCSIHDPLLTLETAVTRLLVLQSPGFLSCSFHAFIIQTVILDVY